MNKVLIGIMLLLTVLITGCISEKDNDEKVSSNQDIVAAILELANSNGTRTTAGEVQNASNGVYSGVYFKIGSVIYTYEFSDLALLDNAEKSEFMTKWNSAAPADSYIVYE